MEAKPRRRILRSIVVGRRSVILGEDSHCARSQYKQSQRAYHQSSDQSVVHRNHSIVDLCDKGWITQKVQVGFCR
jgi:hypothetical protein